MVSSTPLHSLKSLLHSRIHSHHIVHFLINSTSGINKPSCVIDRIHVTHFSFGDVPPEIR